jgi:hypothetical protein
MNEVNVEFLVVLGMTDNVGRERLVGRVQHTVPHVESVWHMLLSRNMVEEEMLISCLQNVKMLLHFCNN